MAFRVVVDGAGIVVVRIVHEVTAKFRTAGSEHGNASGWAGHDTAQKAKRGPVVNSLLAIWCGITGNEVAGEIEHLVEKVDVGF